MSGILILRPEGIHSLGTKNQKQLNWSINEKPGKMVFKEQNGQIRFNWWKAKHTLLVQGKPEVINKFKEKLNQLINSKKEVFHIKINRQQRTKMSRMFLNTVLIPSLHQNPKESKKQVKSGGKKSEGKKEQELEKKWKAIS